MIFILKRLKKKWGSQYLNKEFWMLLTERLKDRMLLVTAEKNNIQTASYFWVGAEAPIKETYPTRWKRYDHDFPFHSRIDSVVAWLSMPKPKRPRLCLLYFHEPDHTGHETGPKSNETAMMVTKMDSLFGMLISQLEELPIASKLNILVVSDHGMTEISSERTIDLSNHIDMNKVKQEGSGPYSLLYDMDKNEIKNINIIVLSLLLINYQLILHYYLYL